MSKGIGIGVIVQIEPILSAYTCRIDEGIVAGVDKMNIFVTIIVCKGPTDIVVISSSLERKSCLIVDELISGEGIVRSILQQNS